MIKKIYNSLVSKDDFLRQFQSGLRMLLLVIHLIRREGAGVKKDVFKTGSILCFLLGNLIIAF